jgi:hypothetical protein
VVRLFSSIVQFLLVNSFEWSPKNRVFRLE